MGFKKNGKTAPEDRKRSLATPYRELDAEQGGVGPAISDCEKLMGSHANTSTEACALSGLARGFGTLGGAPNKSYLLRGERR